MRKQQDIQDFDLMVGSVLRDAEVKAPSRVWKAVAARLDDSPAPAPAWWKWAGASLAFAAAAALTLVLTGTFRTPAVEAVPGSLVAEVAVETPAQEPVTIIEATTEMPVATAQAAPVRRKPAKAIEVVPIPAAEEPIIIVHEETAEEVSGSEAPVAPEANDVSAEEIRQTWDRIIAEETAARKAAPVSLIAHGLMGSNNLSGGTPHPWMGAAGSFPSGIKEDGASTFGVPFTVGAGVRIGLGGKLSIGTGLDYSLLARTFAGTYQGETADFRHTVQYIGVPVNLFVELLSEGSLGLYAFAGGEAEYCVSNKYGVLSSSSDMTIKAPVKGLQYSVGTGIGVEFGIADRLSLYFDPSVRYYFDSGQPKSIRTERPLMFNFEAGLRFKL